jgi:hypothetical protein
MNRTRQGRINQYEADGLPLVDAHEMVEVEAEDARPSGPTVMSASDRGRWMNGTERAHEALTRAVRRGEHRCDSCDATAVAISHTGTGSPVVLACGPCYREWIAESRRNRPSREALVAHVVAARRSGVIGQLSRASRAGPAVRCRPRRGERRVEGRAGDASAGRRRTLRADARRPMKRKGPTVAVQERGLGPGKPRRGTWERERVRAGEYEINEIDPWGRRLYIATISRIGERRWAIREDGGRLTSKATLAKATAWVVANRVAEALR